MSSTSYQRSYQATDETAQALSELRAAFKLSTDSAVVRRSLALARLIAKEAKDDHSITIQGRDGKSIRVILDA